MAVGSRLKLAGAILVGLLLSPLAFVLVAVAMVLVAVLGVYAWLALRWQSWRYGVWFYVVCSTRRGWREFLANNLVEALPPGVGVVWMQGNCDVLSRMALQALRFRGAGIPKPYLAEVRLFGVRIHPLHERLRPLKNERQPNDRLQQRLRELLEQEMGMAC